MEDKADPKPKANTLNKLFAGEKESESESGDEGDQPANFSAKLNKKERKMAKKKAGKDKITVLPRVLTSGVTAASKMPVSKAISKKAG